MPGPSSSSLVMPAKGPSSSAALLAGIAEARSPELLPLFFSAFPSGAAREAVYLVFLFGRQDTEHLLVRLLAQLLHLIVFLIGSERAVRVDGPRLLHHLLLDLAELLFLFVRQVGLLGDGCHALAAPQSAHPMAALRTVRLRLRGVIALRLRLILARLAAGQTAGLSSRWATAWPLRLQASKSGEDGLAPGSPFYGCSNPGFLIKFSLSRLEWAFSTDQLVTFRFPAGLVILSQDHWGKD
jgi:hypothetical protein